MTNMDAAAPEEHMPRALSRAERMVISLVCFLAAVGFVLVIYRYTMPVVDGPYMPYAVEDVRKEESVASGFRSVTRVVISHDDRRYSYSGRTTVKLLGLKKADLLRLVKGDLIECKERRRVGVRIFSGIEHHVCKMPRHERQGPGDARATSFLR